MGLVGDNEFDLNGEGLVWDGHIVEFHSGHPGWSRDKLEQRLAQAEYHLTRVQAAISNMRRLLKAVR